MIDTHSHLFDEQFDNASFSNNGDNSSVQFPHRVRNSSSNATIVESFEMVGISSNNCFSEMISFSSYKIVFNDRFCGICDFIIIDWL